MPGTLLLSAFYFGSVEHYVLIARSSRVVIDAGEHYARQSYRTRTSLAGPNGQQDLNVTIERRSGEKMPMHTVRLSYAEPWNRQHLQAIRSVYGQTPWFIHYIDTVEELLGRHWSNLLDLDLATMHAALKWTGITTPVEVSHRHVEDATSMMDLREALQPKKDLPPSVPTLAPYPQVFSDRLGFMRRMSILDLLMNTGPQAAGFLRG